jgi:hypothetical protein
MAAASVFQSMAGGAQGMNDRKHKVDAMDLLKEAARIAWRELEPHYARGALIQVDTRLDLIDVATSFANDERDRVEAWIGCGQVLRLMPTVARDWRERDPELWAVVTAPWVLVQERRAS